MAINVGSLLVSLGLDSAEFKTGLSQAEKDFKRSTKRLEAAGKGMADLGSKMSLAVTAPLVAFGVTATKAATESRAAFAQVQSALASMGAASGKTAEDLKKSAAELQSMSTFDDDEILQKVTANLLTFGNVSGQVFDRAQQAAVNLSARLGQDLQSSAIQLGKALNDPVKGITALARVGVSFTAQQQEQIKAMVKAGDVAGAQSLILRELERQYGGAAKAARDASPNAAMIDAWREFQETVGEVILKVLPTVTNLLRGVLDAFNSLSPGVQEAIVYIGGLAAVLGPIIYLIGNITTALAPFIAGIKLAASVATAAGVQVTTFSLAVSTLRAALLTGLAVIGPWVAAIAALAAVVYLATRRSKEETQATEALTKAQEANKAATDKASSAIQTLAVAHGAARAQAIAQAKAERENIKQKLASARASVVLAKAELARAQAYQSAQNRASFGSTGVPGTGAFIQGTGDRSVAAATEVLKGYRDETKKLEKALGEITAAINAPAPTVDVPTVDPGKDGPSNRASNRDRSGRSVAEIAQRFNDELASYAQQTLSAMQQITGSADERAELELRGLELARVRTLAAIDADEEYSKAQKDRLRAQVEALAEAERAGIEFQRKLDAERQAADLAQIEFDRQRDMLGFQVSLAETQGERKRLALQILALEQQYRRQQLEMVLASQTATDAEKKRAQAILDSLDAIEAGETASASRANETDVERYLRDLNKSPEQINEAIDSIKINGLEALSDALVDAIVNFRSLADVAKQVVRQVLSELLRLAIQQAIIKPLASAIGLSVPGFAKGTNYAPGGLALVGERGPELVNLRRGSQVIPNHELGGLMGGGNTFNIYPQSTGNERMDRANASMTARAIKQRLNA